MSSRCTDTSPQVPAAASARAECVAAAASRRKLPEWLQRPKVAPPVAKQPKQPKPAPAAAQAQRAPAERSTAVLLLTQQEEVGAGLDELALGAEPPVEKEALRCLASCPLLPRCHPFHRASHRDSLTVCLTVPLSLCLSHCAFQAVSRQAAPVVDALPTGFGEMGPSPRWPSAHRRRHGLGEPSIIQITHTLTTCMARSNLHPI